MKDLIEELQEKIKLQNKKLYHAQEKKLLSCICDGDIQDVLSDYGCFIAGGAITSVFTNKEVNDLDVYFRSLDSLISFVENMFGELKYKGSNIDLLELSSYQLQYCGHTKKSILCKTLEGQEVQLIHDRFYETPEDIFNNFDFHLNMGAYDCKEGMFVLSDKFLTDNSARVMTVNPNTAFPIISQLRIDKYKQRGYSINRKEFILLCCAVSKLNFQSWSDVKYSIGGMYGYNVEEVFNEDVEFSYDELYKQLIELEAKDSRFLGLECFVTCSEVVGFIKECHNLKEEQTTLIPQAPATVY